MGPTSLSRTEYDPESKEEFIEVFNTVKFSSKLRSASDFAFILIPPAFFSMLWVLADFLQLVPIKTPHSLSAVLFFGLIIVYSSRMYIGSNLENMITNIGDVIEEQKEYYSLMGEFIQSLYRPNYHAFILYIAILTIVSSVMFTMVENNPNTISAIPIVLIISAFLSAILAMYAWGIVTFSVFMGWKLQAFTIKLDVTKSSNHLGLKPYGEFIFRALLINLVGYSVVVGYIVFFSFNPILLTFIIFGTSFTILWFIGSQYGLHKAIVSTKTKRLNELQREYGSEVEDWFITGGPDPEIDDIKKAGEFLEVKREIEDIPEWPSGTVQLARVVGAATSANLLAALPTLF